MSAPRTILASLAALALLAGGCGSDDGSDGGGGKTFSAATAASATRDKGTARMTMTIAMSGLGLGREMQMTAEGVTSLSEAKADFRMDLSEILTIAGQRSEDPNVRVRFDGADVYVDLPQIPGIDLPGGDGWIAVDIREVVEALGIDPEAAAALFTVDPASQLRTLQAAGALEERGTEEIRGVPTTHYEGRYSINDVIDAMPADRRDAVREAVEKFGSLGDQDILDRDVPVEIWADGEGVVHRTRTATDLPGSNGAPGGHMDMTYELHDFGARLDVSRPDGAEDVTDMILRALKGQSLQ